MSQCVFRRIKKTAKDKLKTYYLIDGSWLLLQLGHEAKTPPQIWLFHRKPLYLQSKKEIQLWIQLHIH